jgi:hypothetical protein
MSTVILDTITGKSTSTNLTIGSTPVVSASANSMTIRGEGTAQTSIQQGLAKTWGTVDNQATLDSFNNSSDTDVSAGQFEHNFTNNFAAANYSSVVTNGNGGGVKTYTASNWYTSAMYTTALSRSGFYYSDGSAYTDTDFSVARFGDLA